MKHAISTPSQKLRRAKGGGGGVCVRDEYSQVEEYTEGRINLNQVFSSHERAGTITISVAYGECYADLQGARREAAVARIREIQTRREMPINREGLSDDQNAEILYRKHVKRHVTVTSVGYYNWT